MNILEYAIAKKMFGSSGGSGGAQAYHLTSVDDLPSNAPDGSLAIVTTMEKGWLDKTWNGITYLYGNNIWTDGNHIYYSELSSHYVLNGDTWEEKTWEGLSSFYGQNIWTDGNRIYYSDGSSHYILNGNTWEEKTWEGLTEFSGFNVVTDGTNICCRDNGVYDSSSRLKNYTLYKLNADGWIKTRAASVNENVWSDGKNIYSTDNGTYNPSESKVYYGVYKFNGYTATYDEVSRVPFSMVQGGFWTDGNIWYYNYSNFNPSVGGMVYALYTFEDGIFTEAPTMNVLDINGETVWTDGKDTYASTGTKQYVLGEYQVSTLYARTNGDWIKGADVPSGGGNTPTAYQVKSVDELPADAVDGSLAIVQEDDSDIVGVWVFNDDIRCNYHISLHFESNGEEFDGIFEYAGECVNYFYQNGDEMMVYSFYDGWDEAYRNINILEKPDADAEAWVRENAKKPTTLYSRENGEWVSKGEI